MSERPTLYIIDGHAVAYRQFYALPASAFSTKDGELTNAVYGFTRVLADILLDERPKYLAVSFDRGLSGRDEIYEEYKATREKMPDELRTQLDRIRDVVHAFNIPIMELEGYEADDVIGTIAAHAEAEDINLHIITGDKDLLQLVSENVRVQLPSYKNKPDQVYDTERFREKYGGLEPAQLVDLKALMGDSSDNIPGIYGIGEKTGTSLLQKYHSLDGIYEHIDKIKGAKKEKLVTDKEKAYISYELARIQRDLPIDFELEQCVAQDFDFNNDVAPVFRELEFRSLFDRFASYNYNQLPLFGMAAGDDGAPPERAIAKNLVIVQDKPALDDLVETLNNAEAIVWDVETTSVDPITTTLVGIALAVDEETGYYVPVGHDNGQQIAREFVIDALTAPMTNPDIPKYAHNASFDLAVMQRYGLDVSPITFDTMIAEWLRDPVSKFLGLKNFARQYLMIPMTDIEELIGSGKKQITMAQVEIERAAAYAAADAVVTMQAVNFVRGKMQKQDESTPVDEADRTLQRLRDATHRLVDNIQPVDDSEKRLTALQLLHQIEMPLVPVIVEMERNGVVIDTAHLRQMSKRLDEQIADLEATIYELGESGEFNINSPSQLNDVLFENLQLPVEGLRKLQNGYSTDVNTLEALQDEHPIIDKIFEYRELAKLKSTYVDALPELVNPQTGRVHTSYNQTGTSTGRFSSSQPNLQNIPIRTELGREVRRAFVAPQGHVLLAVDYSQIELRVMAHISGDTTLREAFEAGQDIHRATAAAVYDVEPETVTYEQRSFAKRVNFGLMYGMGAYRLARDSELTLGEAEDFIETYFDRLPGVERYIKETEVFAKKHGYVETLLGRRRYFATLKGGRSGNSYGAEIRAAINMPIQGTAADILKIAMIDLYNEMNARDSRATMNLQVHDELVLEVPEETIDETTELVVSVMENAFELAVPLVANAEVGSNWRDLEPVAQNETD